MKTQRRRCGNAESAAMSVVVVVVGEGFTGRKSVRACVRAHVCVFYSMGSELSQPLPRSQCKLGRRKDALSSQV